MSRNDLVADGSYLKGAGLALKAGKKDEAAEFFMKGGEYDTAALLFEQLGNHARAAEAYERAGQSMEAAQAFTSAGRHEQAAEIYEAAGEIERAASAYAELGNYDRAAACYADAGRFLEAAKMASEANAEKNMIGYLQKVTPDHADYQEAVVVLARALTRRGWSSIAVDTIETALGDDDVREQNLELWYALARAHEEQGEITTASEILERIMACRFDFREADSWAARLTQRIDARDAADKSFDGERYAIGELLGRGGMGAVYRATDLLLGRDVAYKVLPRELAEDPAAREALLSEARAAAALNHPNIVTVHDLGFVDGTAFISMELVDGESYTHILRRQLQLSFPDVLHFLVSVCQGLDHAHRKGVVHRDIKPSNVLLTTEGRVKIVDFGLARRVDADGNARVGGTLKYIAPEQARGEATDGRTDLYSLGATLYELIAGEAPFTTGNLVEHHSSSEPAPLRSTRPDTPPALEELVLKLLEKSPADRFESARASIAFVQERDLYKSL